MNQAISLYQWYLKGLFIQNTDYKTMNRLLLKFVPKCEECESPKQYLCVQKNCKNKQPICLKCQQQYGSVHFLHTINSIQFLLIDQKIIKNKCEQLEQKKQRLLNYLHQKEQELEKGIQFHKKIITEHEIFKQSLKKLITEMELKNFHSDHVNALENIKHIFRKNITSANITDECINLFISELKKVNFFDDPEIFNFQNLKRQCRSIKYLQSKLDTLKTQIQGYLKIKNYGASHHLLLEDQMKIPHYFDFAVIQKVLPKKKFEVTDVMKQIQWLKKSIYPLNMKQIKELDIHSYIRIGNIYPSSLNKLTIRSFQNRKSFDNNYYEFPKKLKYLKIISKQQEILDFNKFIKAIEKLEDLVTLDLEIQNLEDKNRKKIYQLILKKKIMKINLKPNPPDFFHIYLQMIKKKILYINMMHKTHFAKTNYGVRLEFIQYLDNMQYNQ